MELFEGEILHQEADSLSLSLVRARLERLLLSTMRTCNPIEEGRAVRVRLVLVDDTQSTNVTIGRGSWNNEDWVHEDAVYEIQATPRWAEECSDEEICAVFAHELGHAVHGDLLRAGPWWVGPARWALPASCTMAFALIGLAAGGVDPSGCGRAMWTLGLGLAIHLFVQAHRAGCLRRAEHRADAYAARFGFAAALMEDLRREWESLDTLGRLVARSPFAHHPTYRQRCRAVAPQHLRALARGMA